MQRAQATRFAGRAVLVLLGLLAALVAAELGVRAFPGWLVGPAAGAMDLADDDPLWAWMRDGYKSRWTDDPDFGARPILGSPAWSEFGTLPNGCAAEKAPGVERIVVLGDSVVRRRHFVQALRERLGNPSREWWNAGVEGFGTEQEVRWYERFTRPLRPDHLILAFHPNDFATTPVVYADELGRAVTLQPGRPALRPNGTLLRASHLYRAWLHLRLRGHDGRGLVAEVRAALARLQRIAQSDGTRLSVVLLPTFAPVADWTKGDRAARQQALELFAGLDLRAFDLLPALEAAEAAGAPLQEAPGDDNHPSRELCDYLAEHLAVSGLLDD